MRHSPLDGVHRALGAKMVPFGGWEMPIAYPLGTLEEHRACRQDAVVFDVSHLGTVRVEGPSAFDALQRELTNDLGKVAPGRAQYTHLLDPDDASVLDDIIVWWLPDAADGTARFDVMPNASNTDGVVGAFTADGVEVRDTTAERAVLAVQGPQARERVATFAPEAAAVGRFRVIEVDVLGHPCRVAGTGYTGEDGLELAVPVEAAEPIWQELTDAGVVPAGLGARDTLRLEAALPLHGHELGPGITPLNAGLGWVVSWDKGDFRGRAALEAQREAGVTPVLRGLRTEGRRPPRAEQDVRRDGAVVGRISSGNFSPTLGCGIALAFVDPSVAVGDELAIDVRGQDLPATCVDTPFVPKH
ncbi:glycine cleavage system aminomethyltransferase GcvT [Dermatobacter hominis]|uniref:glycine cleavage system aminomethyltransferase GcvT n=1 Tax=Dermatobacter hominis TaxID=2884263 RepID=UPI001D0FB1B4|nr:glycine cleavage system aminomethyltransferase GcvT [Dermatobacter hominis]UDY36341.1 glycine cleavage system aminomethyltransferase GcvT [Dermatobacter hominis]